MKISALGAPVALYFGFALSAAAQSSTSPVEGERLSQWLVRQPYSDQAYLPGLSWRVPGEKTAQFALQSALKTHLMGSMLTQHADAAARQRLSTLISSMPITGRVAVKTVDARWLETNAAQDPVLGKDHEVVVPARPSVVVVVNSDGTLCEVPHVSGQEARFYVATCMAKSSTASVPRVWLAQPDGRVQNYGIASWNAQAQDEPAPGAWIWAPDAKSGWAEEFSQQLITFLATQGPARGGLMLGLTAATVPATAALKLSPLRDPVVTSNDWGGIGLLQTPTARMAKLGNLTVGFVRNYPYTQFNFSIQPFDWAELNYRYTSVSGVNYGPVALSGNQSYKDKSIDLKIRLLKESDYVPEVAVGGRDIVGTGLFSGEYVVANKRFGDFDWSLGVGWGSFGSRGSLGTPLGFISNKFKTRSVFAGQGGQVGAINFFRGPAAPLGGVQWHTPYDSLVLKAEYDGNNFQYVAPFNLPQPKSAFNFGAVYRYSPSVDVTLSMQRGNVATLGIAFHSPLAQLATPKLNDPVLPRFVAQMPATTSPATWPNTAKELSLQTGWQVDEIRQVGRIMEIDFTNADAIYWREMTERATAVLHRDAPATVEAFHFIHSVRGTPLATHVIDRAAWVKSKSQPIPPSEAAQQRDDALKAKLKPADLLATAPVSVYKAEPQKLTGDVGFAFRQSLGGPDGFLLYQVNVDARAELKLSPNTWASGTLRLRALDNYKNFNYTAPSNLPRVRTLIREYSTSSRLGIANLQVTHTGQLAANQFYSVYGGYLESMYAGVGGEWLYRPLAGPLALGIDVNNVRQRDFDQRFKLRDYGVTTGHATAYINTGWNDVMAKVSVGQYLAKDKGITVDLSRTFNNGVSFGVYATKTNVSAAQFGEGSFDKGIYFAIPFSAMFTRSTPDVGVFNFNPLIRDGGAKLNRAYPLYELTRVRDQRALRTETP